MEGKKKNIHQVTVTAVRQVTYSSCSVLEFRISFYLIPPTHLLFPVMMGKIICLTTVLSLDNLSEFHADTSGIDSH